MYNTTNYSTNRILSLIAGNFIRKEFRSLTIDQMLELGRLLEEEGLWKPGRIYNSLENDDQFELIFDPKYNFHKTLERIDIFVNIRGEVFLSEKAN